MSIILRSQSERLSITTSSTSEISYSFTYNVTGKQTFGDSSEGLIVTATNTEVVSAPSPNYFYEITNGFIVNNGLVANVVQVNKIVNGVSYPQLSTDVSLLAGEYLQYNTSEGWRRYNASGEFMTVGSTGANGLSAYQVAVANGFIGTEAAWLASLVGPVQSVVAGTNITVDNTDPANPIVSSTGSTTAWGGITGTLSAQTDLQTALDGKVDENVAITGATKTKITYDAKGLVTAGADATTADIADSLNKRYVTDANLTVINNTSGVNTGDQNLAPYFNKSVDDSDDITEGVTNLFWSNSRTINSVLTGLSVTGTTIISTDTILQAFGKAQNQINSLVGGVNYQGSWNATTNTPALTSSVGTKGYYYVVSVAGSTNLDGITDWKIGDWVIFNGTVWEKIDNTDSVVSVNGYTGIVVLTTGDVADSTNKRYVTDANLTVINNTSGVNTGDQTNITGNAATVTTNANLTGPVTSVGNTTSIANGAISNAMLANPAVADLTGSNSGDNAPNSLYSGLISGPTYSIGTSILDFGDEQSSVINTISYATVTAANFRGITFLPTETSSTSLDDYTLNGVTFAIENIVDGVSFDIRGSAINNASGDYAIKYQIATN